MKIVFMGTPAASVPSLAKLISDGHKVTAVYTQPDRPSGRGKRVIYSPVKQFAVDNDLPVYQPLKIRTDEAIEQFRTLKADAAIVVAYGRILPDAFLSAFPRGAINVHFSLLPEYRGAAPVNWAIVNGETETGITTMKMDAGLDTGDILLQSVTKIGGDETSIELMERLSFDGSELLAATLNDLDTIVPRQQQHQLATLAPILKKEDGLIDWKMSAGNIRNRVRGFQPFPSSYTYHDGSRITLWRTSCMNDTAGNNFAPGEVVLAAGGELQIGCGEGTVLAVEELQVEGKRRVSSRDFLNGSKLREGSILGN